MIWVRAVNGVAMACAGLASAAAVVLLPPRGSRRLVRLGRGEPARRLDAALRQHVVAARNRLRRARLEEATAAAVVGLADALAAELLVGRPAIPALVLAGTAIDDPMLGRAVRPVFDLLALGGDVAGALTAASVNPGCRGLGWLAIAWQVAEGSGAGLAVAVTRIADVARAEGEHRRDVRAQLAGPRATAALLAVLPLVGILLGVALGADPLAILLGTPGGLACLVVGLGLEMAGLRWTSRLAAAAERAA